MSPGRRRPAGLVGPLKRGVLHDADGPWELADGSVTGPGGPRSSSTPEAIVGPRGSIETRSGRIRPECLDRNALRSPTRSIEARARVPGRGDPAASRPIPYEITELGRRALEQSPGSVSDSSMDELCAAAQELADEMMAMSDRGSDARALAERVLDALDSCGRSPDVGALEEGR